MGLLTFPLEAADSHLNQSHKKLARKETHSPQSPKDIFSDKIWVGIV